MLNPQDLELEPSKGRRAAVKRGFWIIALILVLSCAAYWVKSQLGIDLLSSMSMSTYFPFKYLKIDVIEANEPGTIIFEDFDHFRIFNHWSDASFDGDAQVVKKIVNSDLASNAQCLQVASSRPRRWGYAYAKYISVTQGDLFRFKGLAHMAAGSKYARLRIVTFDEDKNALDWLHAVWNVRNSNAWVKVEKSFTIDDDKIRYIKFQLTGGKGVYRFDNLLLGKLKRPDSDQ